jgi:hypothetical protein
MHVLFLPFHIMASASFACINLLYGCSSVVSLMVQMQDIPKHNFFNIVNLSLSTRTYNIVSWFWQIWIENTGVLASDASRLIFCKVVTRDSSIYLLGTKCLIMGNQIDVFLHRQCGWDPTLSSLCLNMIWKAFAFSCTGG